MDGLQKASVLEARRLDVGYDGQAVVRNVDLRVAAGEVVTLIGPNGAGKSTMLKTMAGLLAPVSGQVLLCGSDLTRLSGNERSRHLSVLLTDRVRTDLMTCADMVESGRHPYTGALGILSPGDHAAVRDAMELAEVWDLRDRDFMQLSDGQRQRVMLARAICQGGDVLVLDEPASHLDVRYQISLLRILRRLACERGVGILMTVHELTLARRVSDWLVCVKDGSVMAQGTPAEVFTSAVIDSLFDLEPGTYDVATGNMAVGEELAERRHAEGGSYATA